MTRMAINESVERISRGTAEIINLEGLKAKLLSSQKTGKPLRVKAGFDPTAPDIHLGHTVLLRKLRQFQDLGHTVIFLIGDATGLVGDPSGQSATRKTLTWEEVEKNAQTYIKQVSKILLTDDKKVFERRHNSEWFSRHGQAGHSSKFPPFTFEQFVELAQKYTVARLLERDDFQKRLKEKKPISFLELFYPLMQGYDSYKLQADIEMGGTDQKFNMLVGRDIQHAYGQEQQVVITMPLLEGTDGVNKMSKSLGNYIGINESADEIFGKVMSVSDDLMYRYYEILTDFDMALIRALHPKEAKMKLAGEITARFHDSKRMEMAKQSFEKIFTQGQTPEDAPEHKLDPNVASLVDILIAEKMVDSKREFHRLLSQGAISHNNQTISDAHWRPQIGVVKVGKRRFLKLV